MATSRAGQSRRGFPGAGRATVRRNDASAPTLRPRPRLGCWLRWILHNWSSLITIYKDIKIPKYPFASMRKYIPVNIRGAALTLLSDDRLRRERIAVGCCPLHNVLRDRGFEVTPFAIASLVSRGHRDQCAPLASFIQEVGLMPRIATDTFSPAPCRACW